MLTEKSNIIITEVESIHVHKYVNGRMTFTEDQVVRESPLEIQLCFVQNNQRMTKRISITMRTPGADDELALGFLFAEGIVTDISNVERVERPDEDIIRVRIKEGLSIDLQNLDRNFYTNSGCGVCGKTSLEAIHTIPGYNIFKFGLTVKESIILTLQEKIKEPQSIFKITGGIHAAALFDQKGVLVTLKEDVGRHNALDKLIGNALINDLLPLSESILLLSGRTSFELMQKAIMAGIPIIVSVGAPSDYAVRLAKDNGVTLIGFLKENSFNIYCGYERLKG